MGGGFGVGRVRGRVGKVRLGRGRLGGGVEGVVGGARRDVVKG